MDTNYNINIKNLSIIVISQPCEQMSQGVSYLLEGPFLIYFT